jgi:hypothetical protein
MRQEVHESPGSRRVETADFALDYLQAHDWQPARRLSRGRLLGLCPLHADYRPGFLVESGKNLFYC